LISLSLSVIFINYDAEKKTIITITYVLFFEVEVGAGPHLHQNPILP
jgi:hypothetical protein